MGRFLSDADLRDLVDGHCNGSSEAGRAMGVLHRLEGLVGRGTASRMMVVMCDAMDTEFVRFDPMDINPPPLFDGVSKAFDMLGGQRVAADAPGRILLGSVFGEPARFLSRFSAASSTRNLPGLCAHTVDGIASRGPVWMTDMLHSFIWHALVSSTGVYGHEPMPHTAGSLVDWVLNDNRMHILTSSLHGIQDGIGRIWLDAGGDRTCPMEPCLLVSALIADMAEDGFPEDDPIAYGRELLRRLKALGYDPECMPIVCSFPSLSTYRRWRGIVESGESVPSCVGSLRAIAGDIARPGTRHSAEWSGFRPMAERVTAALESDGRRDFSRVSAWISQSESHALVMGRDGRGSLTILRDAGASERNFVEDTLYVARGSTRIGTLQRMLADESDAASVLGILDVVDMLSAMVDAVPVKRANAESAVIGVESDIVIDAIAMLRDGYPRDMAIEGMLTKLYRRMSGDDD